MNARKLSRMAGLTLLAAGLPGHALWAEEARDYVVIVLDASGSMKQGLSGTGTDKMTAAKAALKEVLQKVPPSTHIGLVVFSAANVKNDWIYPLGPRNDAELMKAIDLPVPNSGTPLGAYIKKGADRLLEERAKQFGYGTYRLLIVTDGEAQDQPLVDRYTPELISRGITVDVIGVGMKTTHTLARKVHSYRAANDPVALRRALSEVFAEVSTTGTDVAQADAFDLIAPIPNSVALAMLQAVSTAANHPLGTKPKPPADVAPVPAPKTKPPESTSPQASTPAAPSASRPISNEPSRSHHRGLPKWVVIAGIVILASVISKARKGARR
jgi:uncharacterized protein YegL